MALRPIMPGADGVEGFTRNGRPATDAARLAQDLAAYRDEVPPPLDMDGVTVERMTREEAAARAEDDTGIDVLGLCIDTAILLLDAETPQPALARAALVAAYDGGLPALLGALVNALCEPSAV